MKKKTVTDCEMYYGATADIMRLACDLRNSMTDAEKKIWDVLRNRKLLGYKFRRQHPISKFIADFYCHEKLLVIEIDGDIHNIDTNKEHDDGRDYEMQQFGLTVLRFTNKEVFENIEGVFSAIKACLEKQG